MCIYVVNLAPYSLTLFLGTYYGVILKLYFERFYLRVCAELVLYASASI